MIKNFEDLEIWKCARVLTKEIYRLTADQKFSRDFKFRDQIRGAAISIMSNIAEGYERGGNQEFIQFLYISKGSCGEVRSLLYVALDEAYLPQKPCEELMESFKRLSVMTSNLIDYLRRGSLKGAKYNEAGPANRSTAPNRSQTA
jgi:four helix bundle protein